jgi:lipopolysaccharide export system protein LptC
VTSLPDPASPPAIPPRADAPLRRIGERLASIVPEPARRHSLGYSRFVLSMRIALPAAAVALLLVVSLWSHINPGELRFAIPKVVVKPDDLENLRMESPRYVGLDERDQPFTITARLASQSAAGGGLTELAEPKGDIALASGAWIAMEAQRGLYDRHAETLDLDGGVAVFQDRGYQLHTDRARFLFRPGNAEGDTPVRGQGPDSELTSDGFLIEDKGARVHLRGAARIVFYPRKDAGPTAPRSGP